MTYEMGFWRRLAGLALATAAVGACDSLLEVQNPAALQDEDLNNPAMANVIANSVRGEFQAGLDDWAYFSAILTDEAVTGHNFQTWKEVDLRDLKDDNGTMAGHWNQIHAVRALADTSASRLRNILGEDGPKDLRTATALAFGGYSYVFAAEFMCGTPLDVSSKVFTPDELATIAISRFEDAIQVAQAAKAAGKSATEADQLTNLSRVGMARAHLWLGNAADASAVAAQVPDDFVYWMRYSSNSGRETNLFRGATQGSNRNLGVDAGFRFLDDPRVRHSATSGRGHNNLTELWDPFAPPSFSVWEASAPSTFDRDTGIRLASGLEARYIKAEADGPGAATLALVNERRAVADMGDLEAGADQMAALRDQRRRDFFLDGHRLGDLRRWKESGVGDFFPTGRHPNDILQEGWGTYGSDTCIPIPLAEKIGNPNIS